MHVIPEANLGINVLGFGGAGTLYVLCRRRISPYFVSLCFRGRRSDADLQRGHVRGDSQCGYLTRLRWRKCIMLHTVLFTEASLNRVSNKRPNQGTPR